MQCTITSVWEDEIVAGVSSEFCRLVTILLPVKKYANSRITATY